MNVRNCRKCGKIFNYVAGPFICPACKEKLEESFQRTKKYVQDHRGATVQEVSQECEVDVSQIREWVREERLEFANGDASGIGLACEKCGASIPSGRFCEKCKAEMTNGFNNVLNAGRPKPEAPKHKDPRDNPKMRFL